eukprot:TRINITY_DN3509_c0_g1_i3.p1 TRINITY_DN3509_c0_g1~~TRINITY_DN3509_c0_g1_i3.p1  ORF type:complete len:1388 (+),score=231.64 TRINITY_DN3509_c0_g1_i3:819-4982(+)
MARSQKRSGIGNGSGSNSSSSRSRSRSRNKNTERKMHAQGQEQQFAPPSMPSVQTQPPAAILAASAMHARSTQEQLTRAPCEHGIKCLLLFIKLHPMGKKLLETFGKDEHGFKEFDIPSKGANAPNTWHLVPDSEQKSSKYFYFERAVRRYLEWRGRDIEGNGWTDLFLDMHKVKNLEDLNDDDRKTATKRCNHRHWWKGEDFIGEFSVAVLGACVESLQCCLSSGAWRVTLQEIKKGSVQISLSEDHVEADVESLWPSVDHVPKDPRYEIRKLALFIDFWQGDAIGNFPDFPEGSMPYYDTNLLKERLEVQSKAEGFNAKQLEKGTKFFKLGNRSILFDGPPGIGKTQFLGWMKETSDGMLTCPHYPKASIAGSELFGEGLEGEVETMYVQLLSRGLCAPWLPMLIIIDEMETFVKDRSSGNGESGNKVGIFLNYFKGGQDVRNIHIAGATNFKDQIDAACQSRFEDAAYVGLPAWTMRATWHEKAKLPEELCRYIKGAMPAFARYTIGFSHRLLANTLRQLKEFFKYEEPPFKVGQVVHADNRRGKVVCFSKASPKPVYTVKFDGDTTQAQVKHDDISVMEDENARHKRFQEYWQRRLLAVAKEVAAGQEVKVGKYSAADIFEADLSPDFAGLVEYLNDPRALNDEDGCQASGRILVDLSKDRNCIELEQERLPIKVSKPFMKIGNNFSGIACTSTLSSHLFNKRHLRSEHAYNVDPKHKEDDKAVRVFAPVRRQQMETTSVLRLLFEFAEKRDLHVHYDDSTTLKTGEEQKQLNARRQEFCNISKLMWIINLGAAQVLQTESDEDKSETLKKEVMLSLIQLGTFNKLELEQTGGRDFCTERWIVFIAGNELLSKSFRGSCEPRWPTFSILYFHNKNVMDAKKEDQECMVCGKYFKLSSLDDEAGKQCKFHEGRAVYDVPVRLPYYIDKIKAEDKTGTKSDHIDRAMELKDCTLTVEIACPPGGDSIGSDEDTYTYKKCAESWKNRSSKNLCWGDIFQNTRDPPKFPHPKHSITHDKLMKEKAGSTYHMLLWNQCVETFSQLANQADVHKIWTPFGVIEGPKKKRNSVPAFGATRPPKHFLLPSWTSEPIWQTENWIKQANELFRWECCGQLGPNNNECANKLVAQKHTPKLPLEEAPRDLLSLVAGKKLDDWKIIEADSRKLVQRCVLCGADKDKAKGPCRFHPQVDLFLQRSTWCNRCCKPALVTPVMLDKEDYAKTEDDPDYLDERRRGGCHEFPCHLLLSESEVDIFRPPQGPEGEKEYSAFAALRKTTQGNMQEYRQLIKDHDGALYARDILFKTIFEPPPESRVEQFKDLKEAVEVFDHLRTDPEAHSTNPEYKYALEGFCTQLKDACVHVLMSLTTEEQEGLISSCGSGKPCQSECVP